MVQIDPKGANNRAPIFPSEKYPYLKDFMYVHLMYVDLQLWIAIEEGPQKIFDGVSVKKTPKEWNEGEIRKPYYDLKVRNILISSLCLNVYFSISYYKTTKVMWGTLQVIHEGTEDVKQSKINILMEK